MCVALAACGDADGDDADAGRDAGSPGACTNSLDCTTATGDRNVCGSAGRCVECVVQADCDGTASCRDDVCVAQMSCKNSLDCDTSEVCDPSSRRCVECVADADCGAALTAVCVDKTCQATCESDNACTPMGLLCDISAGYCVECVEASDCPDGQSCMSGQCIVNACKPLGCADVEPSCGSVSDGCGGTLRCGSCDVPSCSDGMRNGDETATDCGGPSCDKCSQGMACTTSSDCTSNVCDALVCAAPQAGGTCGAGTEELGRYAEWCGKVNLHLNASGEWETDPDCTSGCGKDPLTYCQKFYPTTVSTQPAPVVGVKPFENAACAAVYPYIGETEILCCGAI